MGNNITKLTIDTDSSEDGFSIKKTQPNSSNAACCKSPRVIIDLINKGKTEDAFKEYEKYYNNPYGVEGNEDFTNMIDRNELLYAFDPFRLYDCHNVLLHKEQLVIEDGAICVKNKWAEKEPHYFVRNLYLAFNENHNVVEQSFLFFTTVDGEIKPFCIAKLDIAKSIINKILIFTFEDTIQK